MDSEQTRKLIALLRMAVGSTWLVPGLGARVLGVDPDLEPSARLLLRLFAIRDLVLGALALRAEGADADRHVDVGLVVDAADLAALLLAVTRRQIRARTFVLGAGTAAAAVGAGLRVRRARAMGV